MESQALSYLSSMASAGPHHFPQEPVEGANRVCHFLFHLGTALVQWEWDPDLELSVTSGESFWVHQLSKLSLGVPVCERQESVSVCWLM